MIVFDTETTGLAGASALPLEKQPYITELCAIKLSDKKPFKEVGRVSFLAKPPIPIPAEVVKITGIDDALVADAPPFAANLRELSEFFVGERVVVAHNLEFDLKMLSFELRRLRKVYHFPWPPNRICTVDSTKHIRGHRLKLAQLHEEITGKAFKDAHRADPDTEALVRCVQGLLKEGVIEIPSA